MRLVLVGADTLNLGRAGTTDSGEAPPMLYVARDLATWKAIFDERMKAKGATGVACAAALQPIRDAVTAHDFTTGALILLIGPAADRYTMGVAETVDVLEDGTGRVVVTHRRENREGAATEERLVRWTLHRVDGDLPAKVLLRANGKEFPASN